MTVMIPKKRRCSKPSAPPVFYRFFIPPNLYDAGDSGNAGRWTHRVGPKHTATEGRHRGWHWDEDRRPSQQQNIFEVSAPCNARWSNSAAYSLSFPKTQKEACKYRNQTLNLTAGRLWVHPKYRGARSFVTRSFLYRARYCSLDRSMNSRRPRSLLIASSSKQNTMEGFSEVTSARRSFTRSSTPYLATR